MTNWFVIYPCKDKKLIKEEFEKLKLRDFETNIIILDNGISKKDIQEYVKFAKDNLAYSGYIESSSEKDLLNKIEEMSGTPEDSLFVLKNGKVSKKKVDLK